MKVEREIEGFALPFAAGAAAATFTAHLSGPASAGTLMVLSFIPPLLLIHPHIRLADGRTVRSVIALSALLCGLVSGLTENIISTCRMAGLPDAATEILGQGMKSAIDRLPFASSGTGAVIKALLTGDRSGISPAVTKAFRDSGASHILALSGLHLGIIYGIVRRVLAPAGSSPHAVRTRSIITVSICGIYTMATGAGPSIVRAFLFILLNEAARLSGRDRSTGTILMAALVIQLTFSPASVRSAGFQLSYAAMAGIAYIYPRIRKLWPHAEKEGILGWIWNSASMSIACQVTTGPIAWLWFRTFPQHFLLTNLIAIPLSGIIIPVSLFTLILHTLGICPDIMIKATETLVNSLSVALNIISTM